MSMMLGLNLSLTGVGGGGAAPFVPTQPQLVATYTGIPNGSFVQMGSGNVRALGRSGHRSGRVRAKNLQFLDSLIYLSTNGVEAASATLNTLKRAIEIGGVTTQALYAGLTSVGISGSTQALSDIIGSIELPPDTDFFARWEKTLALDTQSMIAHALSGPSGQGFRTTGASQLLSTGAMNSSGTSAGPQFWPNGIFGVPFSPMSAVCIVADSIGNYREDLNSASGGGAWARALNSILGSAVPWMKQSQNGHSFSNASFANAPLQKTQWQYVTDIFIELSTNSMPSSGTVAERLLVLQNGWLNLADGARAITGPYGRRLRVHFFDMIKRDSYELDATQHDTRLAYNAWGAAFADGKADAYYNTDSVVTVPVGSDGIHPASAVHIQAASDVIVPGYIPFLDPFYFPFGV
ncbi:hypothetical protein GFM14_02865 [Rhizobium leguminosarum bv. viciae]|uniref:hypothetical protein n=1 Tax=Rhizobium leguminosarum TaxID=384 RepID=UPI0014419860|nr:hypothetical protein [Rhizobium leguminosarum]NKJ90559.1 hypothetical protein [Rhizobium leguminosarum bv. viciae]